MASKLTSALAQGGFFGKSKVRARALDGDVGASGILKSKTTAFKKPHGKGTPVKAPGSKQPQPQPQTGQVVVEGRKLQQLQDELRLLRVNVVQQGHAIRVLQQERQQTSLASNAPRSLPQETRDEAGNRRATQALANLQVRLGIAPGTGAEQATELEQGSERVKRGWIQDGLLVGSAAFGLSWSRTRQALDQACDRGELFSLKIGNKRWYPTSLMGLSAEAVKAVCLLLRGVDPVSQFIFWECKHGSLAGQTLPQALRAGKTAAVLRTAEVFASEHTAHAALA
jgi:hypothetical protein